VLVPQIYQLANVKHHPYQDVLKMLHTIHQLENVERVENQYNVNHLMNNQQMENNV
jgi:hypothetical protein